MQKSTRQVRYLMRPAAQMPAIYPASTPDALYVPENSIRVDNANESPNLGGDMQKKFNVPTIVRFGDNLGNTSLLENLTDLDTPENYRLASVREW